MTRTATLTSPAPLACALVGALASVDVRAQSELDSSYEWGAAYIADVWRNTRGGIETGTAYLTNVDLTLAVDGERAWGLPGVSAFVYALYNNHARFSERYVGDAMTASNIDAPEAFRLYEAWLEWQASSATDLSLRFGLYDLNSEFDTNASRSLFIHSTHGVGHELAQTGENGPSIFPVTSLAVRAAWSPSSNWRVLAAAFDGVPGDPARPSSNRIRLGGDDGVLGIGEVQWSAGRVTQLALGHWQYSDSVDDVRSAFTARPQARNRGTYGALEIALDTEVSDSPRTSVFARYGVANDRVNEYEDSIAFGLVRRGVLAARPDDELGIAYARTDLSNAAREAASLAGMRRDGYEAAFELTYRAAITDWLVLQPDVQYIVNPGADAQLRDSLAVGLRVEFVGTGGW